MFSCTTLTLKKLTYIYQPVIHAVLHLIAFKEQWYVMMSVIMNAWVDDYLNMHI